MNRDLRFDNIKGVLIYLVVLGHLLELFPGNGSKTVYLIIYSFHMPAFAFVSGYFASFKPRKIVNRLLVPYLIWYTVYTAVFGIIFKEKLRYNLIIPYWLTWYLLSMAWWYLSIPILDGIWKRGRSVRVTAVSVSVGLWATAGVCGYGLSLGRTVTFLPFFAAGHYLRKNGLPEKITPPAKMAAAAAVTVCLIVCVCFSEEWDMRCFYGAKIYEPYWKSMALRVFQLVSGGSWVCLLLCFAVNQSVRLFTAAGRYSAPVFLVHGLIVRGAGCLLSIPETEGLYAVLISALAALLLTAALGNRYVNRLVSKLL